MTWDNYIFKLQIMGVPTEAIQVCESFVLEEMQGWGLLNGPRGRSASFDLGFAELSDITSKTQSIQMIVNAIAHSIVDVDSLGRDITKMRYKQLIANPNKKLKRLVLKSYYLHYMNLNQEPTEENTWGNLFNVSLDHMLNNYKAFA